MNRSLVASVVQRTKILAQWPARSSLRAYHVTPGSQSRGPVMCKITRCAALPVPIMPAGCLMMRLRGPTVASVSSSPSAALAARRTPQASGGVGGSTYGKA